MSERDLSRRTVIGSAAAAGAAALFAAPSLLAQAPPPAPRRLARVILDNDFSGDPDGLFQLAHHLLCPSVDIPLIVGSHLPATFAGPRSASEAAAKAGELLKRMKLQAVHEPIAGAELPIASRSGWTPSPATAAIVREAMRDDVRTPLVYAAGAGLTELALAWLAEPRIGRRIRLVWIGGREHAGLAAPPPGPDEAEFNFSLDPLAARIVFNESDIEIWQVPRDAYRRMLFTTAELEDLAADGPIGASLKAEIDGMAAALAKIPGFPPLPAADAIVLGDSPLVTLTALLPPIQPDPSSSRYVAMPTPRLNDDGSYAARPGARPMRIYTEIDAGLTFRDMASRFRRWARVHRG
jgi:purine nucleosidase